MTAPNYKSHAYAPQDRLELLLFHYEHILMRVSSTEKTKSSIYFFTKTFRYEGVKLIAKWKCWRNAETKQDIWRTGDRNVL